VLVVVSSEAVTDKGPLELRIRAELATENAEAVIANPATPPKVAELRTLARKLGASAAISVVLDERAARGTVWVEESQLEVDILRSVVVSAAQSDLVTVFALRAVEAWRGARLELEQLRRARVGQPSPAPAVSETPSVSPSQPSPPTSASTPALSARARNPEPPPRGPEASPSAPREPRVPRIRLGVGAGVLMAPDELGPGVGLELRAGLELSPRWFVELRAAAPFFHRIESNVGTADLDQELFLLRVGVPLRLGEQPFLECWAGAGVSRFGVRAEAEPPFESRRLTAWSLLVGTGVGVGWPRIGRWWLFADGAMMARLQQPRVDFDGVAVTTPTPWLFGATGGFGLRL